MRVLLDSNAYSRLMRGDDQTAAVVRDATEILMSAVVIGELLYGFRNGSRFDRNATDLRSFLDNPYVTFVPVGPVTADRYSRIAAGLRAQGQGQSHPHQRCVDRGPRHGNGSRSGIGGPAFRSRGRHRLAAAGQPGLKMTAPNHGTSRATWPPGA